MTVPRTRLADVGPVELLELYETTFRWRHRAACRDLDNPGVMFPRSSIEVPRAVKICARCAVRRPCLEYALAAGEKHGVWGAMSARERNKLRKGRR